jgi:hypothetical protein
MYFAVHGYNRRQSTAAQTSQPFKIEPAIDSGLTGGYSQTSLQFFQYLLAPAYMARRALTALDAVLAWRIKTKLRVKRCHAVYLIGRYAHQPSQLFNRFFGQVAKIFLDILQDRYQIPTICRIPFQNIFNSGQLFCLSFVPTTGV